MGKENYKGLNTIKGKGERLLKVWDISVVLKVDIYYLKKKGED
jgi:hypothetical protein